jgi:hypothetical protein
MTQWHPLFAQLLRPLLERYYEIETNMPVGDAPRQADVVLLRRKSAKKPPFHGMWKNLITWNVLEYKGPTVSARLDDLDELVELGLGINRRLNEEQDKEKQTPLRPQEISWWYLANHLGRRFLRDAPQRLGELQAWGQGIWRCVLMQRPLYLVSRVELPVEEDSLPLHVLGSETSETDREVVQVLAGQPRLWENYREVLLTLHPNLVEELKAMAKTTKKGPKFHLKPLIDFMGEKQYIAESLKETGPKPFLEQLDPKQVVEEMGPKQLLAQMDPKQVVEELGPKPLLAQIEIDQLLEGLSPDKVRELKRRLAQG